MVEETFRSAQTSVQALGWHQHNHSLEALLRSSLVLVLEPVFLKVMANTNISLLCNSTLHSQQSSSVVNGGMHRLSMHPSTPRCPHSHIPLWLRSAPFQHQ